MFLFLTNFAFLATFRNVGCFILWRDQWDLEQLQEISGAEFWDVSLLSQLILPMDQYGLFGIENQFRSDPSLFNLAEMTQLFDNLN